MFFVAAVRKYLHVDGWPTEGNNVSMLAENTLKAAQGIIFLLSEYGFLKAARGKTSLLAGDNKRPRQTEWQAVRRWV